MWTGSCKAVAGPGNNVLLRSTSQTTDNNRLYGGAGNNIFIGGIGSTLMVGGKVGNGHDDYNKQLCRFLKRKKIDSIKIVKETLMLQGYDIQKKNRSLEKCQKMNVHFQLSEP